jgi:DinB superfamily
MPRVSLVEAFADYPGRLAVAARAAAAGKARSGEWTPTEVVRHLIAVEGRVWQARLAQLAVDDRPDWAWTEPGPAVESEGVSLAAALATFTAARAETVATLRGLDDVGWSRTGIHATYGPLDVAGLLRLAIDHDEDHLGGFTSPD